MTSLSKYIYKGLVAIVAILVIIVAVGPFGDTEHTPVLDTAGTLPAAVATESQRISPPASTTRESESTQEIPMDETSQSWCGLVRAAVSPDQIKRIITQKIAEVQPPMFSNLTDIKGHMVAIKALLVGKEGECMKAIRSTLLGVGGPTASGYKAFFDLGSRTGDQLRGFQLRFREASKFQQFPFEANPAFNAHYLSQGSNVHYNNFAVGVQNGTLLLTDRSVGSSIVDGSKGGKGTLVRVIDFAEYVGATLSPRISGGSMVVIKMDIEKMEYPVLHRMLITGTLLYADDLLLECHHTSNRPPQSRAYHEIGKEECVELVELMGTALSTIERPFTSVLWNNKKTAKGYTRQHGGFFPT